MNSDEFGLGIKIIMSKFR